jgi:hypothetical protein
VLVTLLAAAGCKFDSDAAGGPFGVGRGESSGGSTSDEPGSSSSAATRGGTAAGSVTAPPPDTSTSEGPGETTSAADPCAGGGGCDEHATCDRSRGAADCRCNDGFFGDGTTCEELGLDGLRVELRCVGNGCGSTGCNMEEKDVDTKSLAGDPDVVYDVTLRFRGVIEPKSYDGPGQDGFFHPDAMPVADGYNLFSIDVGDPEAIFYLNSGSSGMAVCFPLDEEHTVPVRGGTTLRLRADNGNDGCGVENRDSSGDHIVIPDIEPAPGWFDGQFVQVDVIAIEPP